MLIESLRWLTTPASHAARRLGYLGEAVALQSRARRCREAWHGHIEHCHAAVRASLARCAGRRTALVLGSGLALEYPLAELAARFERVVLADIVHLRAIRWLARRHRNVALVEVDLSGVADRLLEGGNGVTAAALEDWSAAPPPCPVAPEGVDWVLSANILSQLPLLPATWLERHCAALSEADIARFGQRLMARHLDLLAGIDAERCLIADAGRTLHAADGRVIAHEDLAGPLGLERHTQVSWDWPVAPPGELGDGLSRTHRVVACHWPGIAR